jgi:hypothetical protein
MPANVETKAILHNRMAAEAIAARLSDQAAETIEQEDVFFRCAGARLKLRILGPVFAARTMQSLGQLSLRRWERFSVRR